MRTLTKDILIALCTAIFFIPIAVQADRNDNPISIDQPPYVDGEVIIHWNENGQPAKNLSMLDQQTTVITTDNFSLLSSTAHSTEELLDALKNHSDIVGIQPNYIYTTLAQSEPWGVGVSGVQSWSGGASTTNGYDGSGIVVAVIDTGVDYNHEDLINSMWDAPGDLCSIDGSDVACGNHGYDFASSDTSGDGDGRDNDPLDYNAHGTHVAGTIAATNNTVGVVGVAPGAQIMAVRALNAAGSGTTADIASGIDFAVNNGADVINMSIGSAYFDSTLQTAVNNAWDSGVVVISAAGNEALQEISYPAGFEKSISVAAIQETSDLSNPDENMGTRRSYFSNYGTVDIAAPGSSVLSAACNCSVYDGTYVSFSGTSMAAPHVAGVAALILDAHNSFSPDQVKYVLESTATDLETSGRDQYVGSGLVNANTATGALSNSIRIIANYADGTSGSAPTIHLQELPADGSSTLPLSIRVMDTNGDFVNNATINISTTAGSLNESSITTDSNGLAEVILTAGTIAGSATVTASSDTYGTVSINVTLANVLYVNDTGDWSFGNTLSWWYQRALNDAEINFMRYDTMNGHSVRSQVPSSEYLQKFDTVIWSVGELSLSNAKQSIIQDYLDNGGNIVISGQDTLYYIENESVSDIIFTDYLGISAEPSDGSASTYSGDDGGSTLTGAGIFSEIIIDLVEYSENIQGPNYVIGLLPDWGDVQSGGASSIATYNSNNESAAVSVDSNHRSIWLGFGLETVELRNSRTQLITEAVNYLLGDYSTRPGNISFSSIKRGSLTASWSFTNENTKNYVISYGTDSNATNLGTLTSTEQTITLTELAASTNIYVKVKAVLVSAEETNYSNIVKTTTVPAQPTKLKLKKRGVKNLTVQWKGTADTFRVKYGTNKKATNKGTATTTKNKKKLTSKIVSNQKYYIKVRAENTSGNTNYTVRKLLRTLPSKVSNVRVNAVTSTTATVRFNKVKRKIKHYKIKLTNTSSGTSIIYTSKSKSKSLESLAPLTTYTVKVRAFKSSTLKGKWSKNISFTTASE